MCKKQGLVNIPWAPTPTFLEVLMVNNLIFRWPKPLFFMVLGAHGIYTPLVFSPPCAGMAILKDFRVFFVQRLGS